MRGPEVPVSILALLFLFLLGAGFLIGILRRDTAGKRLAMVCALLGILFVGFILSQTHINM